MLFTSVGGLSLFIIVVFIFRRNFWRVISQKGNSVHRSPQASLEDEDDDE